MRKILLLIFLLSVQYVSFAQNKNVGDDTYWKDGNSNANWNDNNWWNDTQGWDFHNPNYEGKRNLIFDNNSQNVMVNNFTPPEGVKGWRITFTSNATLSRSITGAVENSFYNVSGNPKIENYSTVGHLINFPIKLEANPMEFNPVNGPMTILGAVNTNGNYIDVYGTGGDSLAFGGGISGTGGLTIKQDSRVIYAGTAVTYSGNTTVEAGQLDLRTSLANSDVTIKSGASAIVYGTGITVKSITVEAGGSLELYDDAQLTITNNLVNSGTVTAKAGSQLTVSGNLTQSGTFTLKSDGTGKVPVANPSGSLIVSGTVTGSISVERFIAGHNNVDGDGWHYIASPVDYFTVSGSDFEPTGSSDLYYWDEVNYLWKNYEASAFDLVKEKGYLCAYTNDATKTFSGNPNNSDVSISGLTLTANSGDPTDNGWNLIGNPFTSAIEWNKTGGSFSLSNVAPTAKIYDESIGNWDDVVQDGIIPAMNGFMVQVTTGTGSLIIPAGARKHDATAWYKNSEEMMKLYVSGGTNDYADNVYIRFNNEASEAYDSQFDSHKLYGVAEAPQLFTRIGDHKFSTNTLADANTERALDMDFKAGTSGEYTIEVLENTLSNDASVYLQDKVTGQMIDLLVNDSYTFNAEVGDAEDRFKLHFGATGVEEIQKEALQAYVSGDQLYILGEEGSAELSIFNIQGQQLLQEQVELNNHYSRTLSLENGIYLLSLQTENKTKTTKVIIK